MNLRDCPDRQTDLINYSLYPLWSWIHTVDWNAFNGCNRHLYWIIKIKFCYPLLCELLRGLVPIVYVILLLFSSINKHPYVCILHKGYQSYIYFFILNKSNHDLEELQDTGEGEASTLNWICISHSTNVRLMLLSNVIMFWPLKGIGLLLRKSEQTQLEPKTY